MPAETYPAFSENLCWLLSRAAWTLTTELTAALEGLGFAPRGHQVLAAAASGSHTQSELAAMTGVDKTTLVVTIDSLDAAGLAERRPSPADRRARIIVVTKAGHEKLREADAIIHDIHEDVLAVLGEPERAAFLDALTQLVRGPLALPAATARPVRRRAPR
jgi:MarR family transcriptional regulator, transcriptional regulator for hemolysin